MIGPTAAKLRRRSAPYRRLATLARLVVGATALAGCASEPQPPDVILITADALRADHLSVNGYPRRTSPSIDRFADRAWHFTDAVTVIPKTAPAFTSLFTGLSPLRHGVRSNTVPVPASLSLLAERLRAGGYRTAAFVSNPAVRKEMGFNRGFETFEELFGDDGVTRVNEAFHQWADKSWRAPSFVWIHYIDPHGPYDPPADLEALFIDDDWSRSDERVSLDNVSTQFGSGSNNKVLGTVPRYQQRDGEDRVAAYVARYDAEIRHVDAAFGDVVARLEQLGRYRDAMVLFTADHGESLGEHDYYFEHGWFAYDTTLRVPLMIKLPEQVRGGVVESQVSLLDLSPTIEAAVGFSWGQFGLGENLFALPPRRPPLPVESADRYPTKQYGVRSSRWKYLTMDGAQELYDLSVDPAETVNLAGEQGAALEALRADLARFLSVRRASPPESISPADVNPGVREQLKALGYLD